MEAVKVTAVSDVSVAIEYDMDQKNHSTIFAAVLAYTDKHCTLKTNESKCEITGLSPGTMYTVRIWKAGNPSNYLEKTVYTKPSGKFIKTNDIRAEDIILIRRGRSV